MAHTRHLERPGGRIAYTDHGGTGPLVVAAPGLGDLRSVYRHLVPLLADGGLRLVTADLRGLGESSTGWDEHGDEAVAGDLLALVGALDDGPAILVGNSLSCAAAVIAATEGPDSVAGLVLLAPFVRPVPLAWWQRAAFTVLLAPPWGRRAWLRYYRTTLHPGPVPADHGDHVARLAANLAEPGRMAALRRLAADDHAEAGRRLEQVTQPTVVVMGTADPDFPDPAAEAAHLSRVLRADEVLIEGSGHYPQSDHPEQVASAVLALARRAGRPSVP